MFIAYVCNIKMLLRAAKHQLAGRGLEIHTLYQLGYPGLLLALV